jgi:hypothetical protein
MHFVTHTETATGSEDALRLPDDVPLVDEWLDAKPAARFVVLDPVVAMIGTALNTHRDQHVRQAIAPLAHLAAERHIAVVAIMHLNKSSDAGTLNRLNGSVGFGAAARSVLILGADPDDPDGERGSRRILAHAKCNVGPQAPSVAYRIETRHIETANGLIETSVAVAQGESALSASDLLGNPTSDEADARTIAREFLLAELEAGPVPAAEMKRRAADADIAWRTIERIKKQIGVRSRKTASGWVLEAPAGDREAGEIKTAIVEQLEIASPVNTGSNATPPTTPPKPPIGGLEEKAVLKEAKTAKTAKPASVLAEAVFDADRELDRVLDKFPDLAIPNGISA